MTLTPLQLRVLRFIAESIDANGYAPTLRDIGDKLGTSHTTAHEKVMALVKKGALAANKFKTRSVSVTDAGREAIDIWRDELVVCVTEAFDRLKKTDKPDADEWKSVRELLALGLEAGQ